MQHELEIHDDADAVARRGAAYVAALARAAVGAHGGFAFAVSGGRTPWAMFGYLGGEEMPWAETTIYQVDERIAPDGDADRNLTQLEVALAGAPATVRAMRVTAADPGVAAAEYASVLPARFDLVHLGLGDDGHTASLVPGDPVLAVDDALVALTGDYRGRRRMTLTYPALARAAQLLWLVTGADKQGPLEQLQARDPAVPAGRVVAARSLIVADAAAAGR